MVDSGAPLPDDDDETILPLGDGDAPEMLALAALTEPGPFTDMLCGAVEAVTGTRPELSTTGGTSDARFIKNYCPVAEFGMISQTMHKVDERTGVDDIQKLSEIYEAILRGYFP